MIVLKWDGGISMTITQVLTRKQIHQLYDSLQNKRINKTPPYAIYQIKMSDCTITAYESGKVVFQGEGAEFYAGVTPTTSPSQVFPQAGSDEVGTGDYFGPVVVCATYIEEQQVASLKPYKIQDSKQMTDETIMKIAPALKQQLKHSILVLDNRKYNHIHETNNMNAIKAKLHNQAFINLKNKYNLDLQTIYVDQFTTVPSYFRYLQDQEQVIRNIHFETKAENKYLSVACASILARYTFLNTLALMSEHYNFDFPKGAGKRVDEAIVEFVHQHGRAKLNDVAKVHFVNTKKSNC